MKTAEDPRHQNRTHLVESLFQFSFDSKQKSTNIKPIIRSLDKIDKAIEKAAPLWPKDKINRIDLAILRLAVYELLLKEVPEKVVVDEAVELGKEYGSESSPSFINGVLGKVIEDV